MGIKFKHEQWRLRPITDRNLWIAYASTCVCIYQRNPLSYPEISVIPAQPSLEVFFFNRGKIIYCQYTLVLVFWTWEYPFFSHAKILLSWEPQEEYVRVNCKSHWLIRKKLLKLIWRDLRHCFIIGTKNVLRFSASR